MLTRHGLRKGLDALLKARGYELRLAGSLPLGYSAFLSGVGRWGVQPRTVFDIGVGKGTPWLYDAFPNAKFVLIEPQRAFRSQIEDICASIKADYIEVALGDSVRDGSIVVPVAMPTAGSLKEWTEPMKRAAAQRGMNDEWREEPVRILPLDDLNGYEPPFFLKIDTEGTELEIIAGATDTLRETQMILMEVSVLARRIGGPSFAEVIAFMACRGFRVVDIPVLEAEAMNGRLLYMDIAFLSDQL